LNGLLNFLIRSMDELQIGSGLVLRAGRLDLEAQALTDGFGSDSLR
jgi:hypothetical protein